MSQSCGLFQPVLSLIGLEAHQERTKSQTITFPPLDPLLIDRPGPSANYCNRHTLLIGPRVICQGEVQLNMFPAQNVKKKSVTWILYINQLAYLWHED